MPHCLSISQTKRTTVYNGNCILWVVSILLTCTFLWLKIVFAFRISCKSAANRDSISLRSIAGNHHHNFQKSLSKRVEKYRFTPKAMFTGIVEEIGLVQKIEKDILISAWDGSEALGHRVYISCKNCLNGAYIGCSLSVNGVCLTVVKLNTTEFAADIAPETLRKTNLKFLKKNGRVNLERGMLLGSRVSGHFVQGHVDNVGTILQMSKEGDSVWVKIQVPKDVLRFMMEKGYVAVDGASLTICDVNRIEGWFNLMLIPHTQQNVILTGKKTGDFVNIEVDMFGKYAYKFLEGIEERLQKIEAAMINENEAMKKGFSCT